MDKSYPAMVLSSLSKLQNYIVNSKETGTIRAYPILKLSWRLPCRSSPVLLKDKILQHTCVLGTHGCQRDRKIGFIQSVYGRSYGGIYSSLYRVNYIEQTLFIHCSDPYLVFIEPVLHKVSTGNSDPLNRFIHRISYSNFAQFPLNSNENF